MWGFSMKWIRTHHGLYVLESSPCAYQIRELKRPPCFVVYRLDEEIARCRELRYAKSIVETQVRLSSKLGGKKPNFHVDKQVRTSDPDYFICEDDNLVTVALSKRRRKTLLWHVAVWGPDDIGMTLEVADYDEAKRLFDVIGHGVTERQLRSLGFKQF